jgi:hypothetical protein
MVINVVGNAEDIQTLLRRFPASTVEDKFSVTDYNIDVTDDQVDDFTDLVEELFLEWRFA